MRKKCLAAVLMAVCVLSGCAESTVRGEERIDAEVMSEEQVAAESKVEEVMESRTQITDENKANADCDYDALNAFSYRLFQENMEEENPVISPISAYIALSMVGMGAQNNTKEEFASVLGDDSAITAICDAIMTTLPTSSDNTTVTLANSVWVDDSFTIYDNWLAEIVSIMHSEVFHTELSAPDVVGNVNEWVNRNTNGLIENMVDQPFDGNTNLVLFNTIYFKAKWESSFEPEAVYEDSFYPEGGNELKTQIMHKQSEMEYVSNEFAEGVILPYKSIEEGDGNFSFVALKPMDADKTVRDLYSELTDGGIEEMLENRQTMQVNLKLPKFEIDFDRELNRSLESMGLKSAFDAANADFGGIGENSLGQSQNKLYIDLVRQKAKIIVDEEGTEAAASTGIMMRFAAAGPQEVRDVWFDRPFVYMIMDMDKEIPLFIGIFDNPAAL